jgi:dephospho-CoA kinase
MNKHIIAIVGMPGAGKSEAVAYLQKKGIPFVRFGEVTDNGVKELGLELTPQNERMVREKIRNELGMAAYAIKSEPRINEILKDHDMIALDGLYSWEEYIYLKKKFPELTLIHVYAEPKIRYARLEKRPIRPLTPQEAAQRDIAELEKLNKGGPIAMADYIVVNNSDTIDNLYKLLDEVFRRIGM